jgi:NADH dehydrogenase
MIDRGDELVTLFGGGGFIGRYVCEILLRSGRRVRIASRNPRSAYFIQPLGQVGQIGYVRADITEPKSIARAVDGAASVVNLCGILKGRFRAVHVTGAGNIAEAARDAGAQALVHISAIGADPKSEADYGKTKGEGESAVRSAFPAATIIRPSLVFGPEDQITNRLAGLARLPFLPVIASQRRFQPVYVRDLAEAIAKAALDPGEHGGKTYEIGGPHVMSMRELHSAILESTGQTPELVDMPNFMASALSWFGWFPGAPLTRDQWRMLQHDNVASKGAPGLEAFGIQPTPLGAVAHEWLGRFHKGGRFAGRRVNLTATS